MKQDKPADDFFEALRIVLTTQRRLLSHAEKAVSDLEADVADQVRNTRAFEEELSRLEADALALPADGPPVGIDPDPAAALLDETLEAGLFESAFRRRRESRSAALRALRCDDWDMFVDECQRFASSPKGGALLPWEALLGKADLLRLTSEDLSKATAWDRWDYAFVGTAGILASLVDCLLVRIPHSILYEGHSHVGSPITEYLKRTVDSTGSSDTWFAKWAQELETTCATPYDPVAGTGLGGMSGRTHRLQTLGHDPALGVVFGVLDILRGTVTGFSLEMATGRHSFVCLPSSPAVATNLIEALLTQIGHLASDVGTKMGVPPPFFTLLQGLNIPSPFSPKGRTIGEISRWMYLNGYDLRHFITMGIAPAVVEAVVRAYLMLRHYAEHGETAFPPSTAKTRCMLLWAHAIACAGNAGKISLMSGNPLAFNFAEWLALFRYVGPTLKHWLFDEERLELARLERENDEGWRDLCIATHPLLTRIHGEDGKIIPLGHGTIPVCCPK